MIIDDYGLNNFLPNQTFRFLLKEYTSVKHGAIIATYRSDQVDILSDESSSETDDAGPAGKKHSNNMIIDRPAEEVISKDLMIKKAQMYQEYMKEVPIPIHRGSVIPFTSWAGLAKSIKLLYNQPLHYLTNILVKQWDKMRIGGENEFTSLDSIIHPVKAEANIWLIEEVHRLTTSHYHLANLWLSDPIPHMHIDSIFPKLENHC